MAIISASTLAIWLIYCLQCIPLAAFWDPAAYPGAKCLSSKITYYVVVALVSNTRVYMGTRSTDASLLVYRR